MFYIAAHSAIPQSPTPQAPPSFDLTITTETPILGPAFGWSGNTQCDAAGNAYFKITQSWSPNRYILRISDDGKDYKRIPLPTDLSKTEMSALYVDPGGTLYELFTRLDSPKSPLTFTYTLVEISPTGNELRRTALQLPQISPSEFAVLSNGRMMVRGTMFVPVEPAAAKGKAPEDSGFLYMAWLDANGQLLHDSGTNQKGHDLFDVSTHHDAAITPGPPGTFLTVTDTSLNTYDSSGTLLHSIPIIKPEKDAFASSIQYLDGQAEIMFEVPHQDPNGKPHEGIALHQVWLFANPEDGTLHAFYQIPNFPGSADCYLGNQNFLYSKVKDTGPIFVEAHTK